MIQHRGCDKQVRERVSNDPGLVGHSHKVREVELSYLFEGFTISETFSASDSPKNPNDKYDYRD